MQAAGKQAAEKQGLGPRQRQHMALVVRRLLARLTQHLVLRQAAEQELLQLQQEAAKRCQLANHNQQQK